MHVKHSATYNGLYKSYLRNDQYQKQREGGSIYHLICDKQNHETGSVIGLITALQETK